MLYTEAGYSLEVSAGEITLAADSTFTTTYSVKETVDGFASLYVDHGLGRWLQASDGGDITLTPSDGPPFYATWSGERLEITMDGIRYVFTRTP